MITISHKEYEEIKEITTAWSRVHHKYYYKIYCTYCHKVTKVETHKNSYRKKVLKTPEYYRDILAKNAESWKGTTTVELAFCSEDCYNAWAFVKNLES